jgi:hypothetical protein
LGDDSCGSVEAELGMFAKLVDELDVEFEVEVGVDVRMDEAAGIDAPGRLKTFALNESVLPSAGICSQAVLRAERTIERMSF